MRKLSPTSIAVVGLVVLFFDDGRASDVKLEASELRNPGDQDNKTEACPDTLTIHGKNIYHAGHQAFYFNTSPYSVYRGPKGYCVPTLDRRDYVVRPGIGAHKLFKHKVTWNKAREICMQDGGQLAVIDSAEKEAIFRSWMSNETLNGLWLGIHDLFEQGSWVTLSGEPVAAMTYYPWAKDEPNNWNDEQHCGILWAKLTPEGISDTNCDFKESFVCEINLCDLPGPIFPGTRMDML